MSDPATHDPEVIRLGVVSYLNAMPLVHGLDDGDGVVVTGAPPSGVAEELRTGRIDVGLVPVVELLRQPDLTVVSDACVGAHGPVDSVVLRLRTAPEAVRTLALDPASRTSQILAQIILRDLHGAAVRAEEADTVRAWAERTHDAVLVIGDPALKLVTEGAPCLDLAQAWLELTDLPFVFAVWAGRRDVVARRPDLAAVLEQARDRGVAATAAIARTHAAAAEIPEEVVRVYLDQRIRYRLAALDRAGLDRFLALARSIVDVPGSEEPCSTSG